MKQLTMSVLAGALCALVLAMPAAAANKPPAKTIATRSPAVRSAWPPENFSGTITMVDPQADVVVVQGPDGVPFDMTVTPATHIQAGDRAVPFGNLDQYKNKEVTIRFVPERRGDVAESIRING